MLRDRVSTIYAMKSNLISRSSKSGSDPLSDVLSLLNTQGLMSGGLDAGGNWAFAFHADGLFRCFSLVSGACWLVLEDDGEPVALHEGDFVALPHGRAFTLTNDLSITPERIESVIATPLNGRIISWQGGGSCQVFSALFTFKKEFADFLLGVLPSIVHIRDDHDRIALQGYLERMMSLLRNPQPGSVLVSEHIAEILLIEILRLHLAHEAGNGTGWLFALADKQIRTAITAMHERPGFRWSIQSLAENAGMSRSAFALRFKEKVGVSVMEYLTRWRMLLAANRLEESADSVATIALSLGYESESAFVFAFKREMGCTPRQYATRRCA